MCRGGIRKIVRDEQHRKIAPSGEIKNEPAHAVTQRHVELAEGLVEQKRLGLRKKRAQKRDACALPARQRGRISRRKARKPGFVQSLQNEALAFGTRRLCRKPKGQIVANRQMRKQQIILK